MPFYILLAAILVGMSGCGTPLTDQAKTQPPYELKNVYRKPLPEGFTRVALMPIVASPDMGRQESLDSVKEAIKGELIKAKRFEVIDISTDTLMDWTGTRELTVVDEWPLALKEELKNRQIDGFMVAEVTHLRGYPPLGMGIKARLVGVETSDTYWACDELFDMGSSDVYAGARQFATGMLITPGVGKAQPYGSVDVGISQFTKYVAYTVFRTLP